MANEFKIKKGLIVTGASGGTVVDIQGSQGQLFSVTDDLSGSIFAVSDISGVPILDVNSSGTSYFDGNVGIGTASPSEKLEVNGITTSLGFRTLPTNTNYTLISRDSAGNSPLYVQSANTSANQIIAKFNYGSATVNAGNNVLTVAKDSSYFQNTNVGIGTASPGVKLDVSGQIRSNDSFLLQSGTTAIGSIRNQGGALDIRGDSTRDVSLGSVTSPQALFVEGTNGNVGIGTISPRDTLEIVGNMRFVDGEDHLMIKPNNAIQGADFIVGDGVDATDTPVMSLNGLYGGQVTIQTQGNTIANKTVLDVQGTQGQLFSVTDDLSGDIFSVTDISGVPIMNVNSDGTSYFDGNVGIGTTSPSEKLEVSGSNTLSIKLSPNNTEATYVTTLTNNYSATLGTELKSGTYNILTHGNGTGTALNFTNGAMTFDFRNSEHMRITEAGNVGIGTTSPTAALDVNGEIAIRGGEGADDARMHFRASDNSNRFTIETDLDGSTSNDLLGFRAAGTDNILVLKGNGNVGIGTTSPGDALEVNGAISTTSSNFVSASTGSILTLQTASAPYSYSYINAAAAGGVMISAALALQTDAGNVGIGTTSPSAKLDVNGDILISNSGDKVFTTDSVNGAFALGDIDALGDEAIVQGDGSSIFLKNAGNTTLTTTVNNRVGIGTTSPGSKLDILGATNTSNSSLLRVRTTRFPNAPEKVVGFYVNTSTERGFISVNQYQTTYSTSSDYRLKENIVPIPNSIERLKELKPCRFNFIQGDPNHVVDGFIAHEAAEVIPEAVTGEKDAVDENNNPLHQGIDQSKVVPLLTAALQEAINKIEQLEKRIQTLENN